MKSKWTAALVMLLLALFILNSVVSADSVNVVRNGSFEEEFINGVGKYWTAFNNGGLAAYTYGDDTWSKTVSDGKRSQLLGIHTKHVGGSDRDRYTGIYQTVNVVPGKRYMFSFYGMVRSSEGSEKDSKWNYRVEFGLDDSGGTDPWNVPYWEEMASWPEYPLLKPGAYPSYAHGFVAETDKMTIFIRVHKKFATPGQEANINIDSVSFVGPSPAGFMAAAPAPASTALPTIPQTGAGDLLPVAGAGLAALVLGLSGWRLYRRKP